jgi:hypothetical protein
MKGLPFAELNTAMLLDAWLRFNEAVMHVPANTATLTTVWPIQYYRQAHALSTGRHMQACKADGIAPCGTQM